MIYDILAPVYDEINSDVDYVRWADFIESAVAKFGSGKPDLVLDLGCGTGRMTLELASRGYDMTGVDYSPEMLDYAEKSAKSLGRDVLWLCQDMCNFELYGTVDLTVSCLDCINHLTSTDELDSCFKLVHNYLVPDGLFIFDINAKHKFETVYADRSYVFESGSDVCIWQNWYDEKRRICDFYITVFKSDQDGRYSRTDEIQRERMYTLRAIKSHLLKAGFEFLGVYSDFEFTEGSDFDDRIYVVAKCKK